MSSISATWIRPSGSKTRTFPKSARSSFVLQGSLCTDPLLEPQPEWAKDERRFQDLVHEQGDQAVLAPLTAETRELFINLIGCGLIRRDPKGQLFRPYTHQLQMLAKGVRDGQAGIVTSGTGAGKT